MKSAPNLCESLRISQIARKHCNLCVTLMKIFVCRKSKIKGWPSDSIADLGKGWPIKVFLPQFGVEKPEKEPSSENWPACRPENSPTYYRRRDLEGPFFSDRFPAILHQSFVEFRQNFSDFSEIWESWHHSFRNHWNSAKFRKKSAKIWRKITKFAVS